MPDTFDAYYKWLGIPPEEQPPHHYRLLGVRVFESDGDVIANAADQRMAHVRTFQVGKYGALSQQLLNEIAAAKVCLLKPEKKLAYDRLLRQQVQPAPPPPPDIAAPPPAAPVAAARPVPIARPIAAPAPPVASSASAISADTISGEVDTLGDAPHASRTSRAEMERRRRKQQSWLGPAVGVGLVALFALIGAVVVMQGDRRQSVQEKVASRPKKERHVRPVDSDRPPPDTQSPRESEDPPPVDPPPAVDPPPTNESPPVTEPKPEKPAEEPASPVVRALLERVARGVDVQQVSDTKSRGGDMGIKFREIPDEGGLLVGLDLVTKNYDQTVVLQALRGVYLTTKGIKLGQPHGDLRGNVIELRAKPGYALGALQVQSGSYIRGLSAQFMRIGEKRLEAKDFEMSQWVGGRGGGAAKVIGGDGQPVVGLFGGAGDLIDGLGLIVLEAEQAPSEPRPLPARVPLATKKRLPEPSADAQKAALELIHSVFKDDYAELAKGGQQKYELAVKLYHKGEETGDDAAAQYMLLCEARDLAARVGDSQAAGEAILALGRRFEIDDAGMALAAFEKAADATSSKLLKRQLVENSLTLLETATGQDKFDVAEQFMSIARKAVGRAQDSLLTPRVNWRATRLREQKTAFAEIAEPLEILKAQPDNPAANLAVGRFRCLYQDEWAVGLPRLAKGSDAELKAIAELELQRPDEADEQLKLAQEWEKVAAGDESRKALYERRAAHWYRRAEPQLHGLSRKMALKKVDELLAGHGLKAEFFRGAGLFKDKLSARFDPQIDFRWGKASPADDVPGELYSVRWTGWLVAPAKGEYQLILEHDDGARMWLDNKPLIDQWRDAGSGGALVPLLPAPRAIRIEMQNTGERGKCILRWAQKGGFAEQVVPVEALFHDEKAAKRGFAPLPYPPYKEAAGFRLPPAAAVGDDLP